MELRDASSELNPATSTRRLAARMQSQICGLSPGVRFILGGFAAPRVVMATGGMPSAYPSNENLTPPMAAHITGTATDVEGALRTVLSETIERHALIQGGAGSRSSHVFTSPRAMVRFGRALLPTDLRLFTDEQLTRPGFPFTQLTADTDIGWTRIRSLITASVAWIPCQVAYLGYSRREGEPWFTSASSSGTAAHVQLASALRNAILELIQADAAMGTWYGHAAPVPIRIGSDRRTRTVAGLIERTLRAPQPRFFWLPNPDLPGMVTACVLDRPRAPRVSVGLGAALTLHRSLWKAFLESVAVQRLAGLSLGVRSAAGESAEEESPGFYDMEANVRHYAEGPSAVFGERFRFDQKIDASALPGETSEADAVSEVRTLLAGFAVAGKDLGLLDLTTPEARELGYVVTRVLSPDTLPLTLPGAPPLRHSRFEAYGGVARADPHPYP